MGLFPGALPVAGTAGSTATLQAAGHTALHNTDRDEIRAIATKLGTGASTPTDNAFLVGDGVGSSSWENAATARSSMGLGNVDDSSDLTILAKAYPVGSVYINATDSTNPGTLLGFGTWVAFGTGRTLVGIDAGQTEFDTAEETGGAKTHTLTTTEMPAHTHTITDPGHTHNIATKDISAGTANVANTDSATTRNRSTDSNTTGITINSSGGGGAHNNLQPYIVCYLWKRTA